MISSCNLQCGITQPILRLFWTYRYAWDPFSLTLLDPRGGLPLDVLLGDLDDGGHAHFVDLVAVDGVADVGDVPPAAAAPPPTEPDLPVRALHLKRGKCRNT